MTNTEAIIRTILGPIRRDTPPLACSVDCLSELLFVQKIPMDEIMVTRTFTRRSPNSSTKIRAPFPALWSVWSYAAGRRATAHTLPKSLAET